MQVSIFKGFDNFYREDIIKNISNKLDTNIFVKYFYWIKGPGLVYSFIDLSTRSNIEQTLLHIKPYPPMRWKIIFIFYYKMTLIYFYILTQCLARNHLFAFTPSTRFSSNLLFLYSFSLTFSISLASLFLYLLSQMASADISEVFFQFTT